MLPANGPVFIADTCIGGLSVLKSLWKSGSAGEAMFMADYAVNPLGVKSEAEISQVLESWLQAAAEHADTLVIACNTLSIRYRQMTPSIRLPSSLAHIVTMVDCFEAMVQTEADRLAKRKVLIIGTEFTARQQVYPDILAAALPETRINTIGATELERKIARFRLAENGGDALLSEELAQAIAATDIAVLACTCFPMVRAQLEGLFPGVIFLDPGAYCPGLLEQDRIAQERRLSLKVTGDVVAESRVFEFAKTYLGSDNIGQLC